MNKLQECATVKAFLQAHHFPHSSLEDCERESPDALICIEGKLIGVEVTQVVQAQPREATAPQRWTTEATRLVSAAQALFESRHSVAVVARFAFRPDWRAKKKQVAEVADELVGIVGSVIQHGSETEPIPYDPIELKDPHPAVAWLFVARTRDSLGGNWAPSIAGEVRSASADDIQETVRRKERRIAEYRRVTPEVWLLIDCNLTGQGFALDVPDPSFVLTTGFDCVYCCGFGMWQWVAIPCSDAHRRELTRG